MREEQQTYEDGTQEYNSVYGSPWMIHDWKRYIWSALKIIWVGKQCLCTHAYTCIHINNIHVHVWRLWSLAS